MLNLTMLARPCARAVVAAALILPAAGAVRAERQDRRDAREPGSLDVLSEAVSGELSDVAGALRRLDQSYVYRGMRGCGAATAGSVYVDWEARGVPPEQRVRVLPPQPLVLSDAARQPCLEPQLIAPTVQPPVQATPCPCRSQSAPAVTPPVTPAPTYPQSAVQSAPCPNCAPLASPGAVVHRIVVEPDYGWQPAEIVYHGRSSNCGGRVPPQAMFVNGQWTELPGAGGCASRQHVDSRGFATPIW